MPVIPIDDPSDPRLADYRNVPDPQLVERRGLFVAEGRLVVRRLLEGNRFAVRSVLVTPAARRALDGDLATLPVYEVPQAVINTITGFNIHRGCLALGERPAPRAWREVVTSALTATPAAAIVVLERVANADNVGAIFRHAAAFGAGAVLLGAGCADPLYRKAIRTSMGAALQVPFARMEPWPAALHELRDDGWSLIGMTPSAGDTLGEVMSALAPSPDDGRKIAILLGHEGNGLTPDALGACTHLARIPMQPGVDSLNVATACAIALYELNRRPPEGGGHR